MGGAEHARNLVPCSAQFNRLKSDSPLNTWGKQEAEIHAWIMEPLVEAIADGLKAERTNGRDDAWNFIYGQVFRR